jgi:secreted trypsin-like serine protease
LVSIRQFENGEGSLCAGSVLRPIVVLTAAHCVSPEPTDPNEPIGGGTPFNSINNYLIPVVITAADVPFPDPDAVPATEALVKTKAVVTSVDWNVTESVLGGFDLALLLLEEDLVGVEAVKLAAPGTTLAAGESLTVAGWGNISPVLGMFVRSPTLMEAQVESIPVQTCVDLYEASYGSDGGQTQLREAQRVADEDVWVCAQGALENGAYTDICQGDSGGPLSIIDGNGEATIVGIASFTGIPCAATDPPQPGVYTNVAKFSSWIERWIGVWERMGHVAKQYKGA